jgi:hypothetical protein
LEKEKAMNYLMPLAYFVVYRRPFFGLWILVVVGIVLLIVWAFRSADAHPTSQPQSAPPLPPPVPASGPGQFKISGVDRVTKQDRVWHGQADSPANARVKAELEGIIVTAVERE